MKVSIVIVSWNAMDFLKNCLKSIYRTSQKIRFEVIVVDNNSKDKTASMLHDYFPQVKLIQNKDNAGFNRANNQGIKVAKGEYIFLLNPDTVTYEFSVDRLARVL